MYRVGVGIGAAALSCGGLVDAVYHFSPSPLPSQYAWLVGPDGQNAHLLTAGGFGLVLFLVLWQVLLA